MPRPVGVNSERTGKFPIDRDAPTCRGKLRTHRESPDKSGCSERTGKVPINRDAMNAQEEPGIDLSIRNEKRMMNQ